MKPESDYIKAKESLSQLKERIESVKWDKRKMQEKLYDNGGLVIYDGEWVEVDKR